MVTRRGVDTRKEHKHSKHNHSQQKDDISINEQDSLSPQEADIIEKSFDTIKKLNTQVSYVQKSKEKLEEEVKKLSNKVDSQSKMPLKHNDILVKIKEEIIKEFAPIINKFDTKSIKNQISKDFEHLIEEELDKVRSEFESNEKKIKRTFTQSLSDLEVRLIESLKEQAKLRHQLSSMELTHAPNILEELEEKIEKTIEKTKKTLQQDHVKHKKELEGFQQVIENHENEIKSSLKEFKRSKTLFENSLKDNQKDSGLLESKVIAVEKELLAMKSLVERYENDLYSKENREELNIEKIVKDKLQQTDSLLKEFSKVKLAHEDFLAKKLNSIIDNVDSFEKRLKDVEKKDIEAIKDLIKKENSKSFLKYEKDFDKFLKNSSKQISKEVDVFLKKIPVLEKSFLEFKNESSLLLKEYLENIDSEMSSFKELVREEKAQRDKFFEEDREQINLFVSQSDEKFKTMSQDLKAFNDFIKKKEQDFDLQRQELKKSVKYEADNLKSEIQSQNQNILDSQINKAKEDISKEILKIQDFMTRSSTEVKEATRDLREDIENKFYQAKVSYDESLEKHFIESDKELSERETSFVRKISELEQEKDVIFKDIDSLKTEIAVLTKEFSQQITKEVSGLKKEHVDFENHKQDFITKLDSLTHTRRVQLNEDYDSYKEEFSLMLSSYKKSLLSQDDTFREVFSQKINTLWEYVENRLQKIDKKFVEKNIGEVQAFFKEEKKELEKYEALLDKKSYELDKKLDAAEVKELEFFESLHGEQGELQEKVEERLMVLEQQLNRRFLDLDEDFAHVKSVVLDEVEGLMKDVTQSYESKIKYMDEREASLLSSLNDDYQRRISSMSTYETKLKFALTEAMKKLQELSNIHEFVENQVRDVRDDVNDLRVKVDVLDPHSTFGSIHSLVATMSDYESHLMGLVGSLKGKGVGDEHILDLLVSKGHPRVYATLLMKEEKKQRKTHNE